MTYSRLKSPVCRFGDTRAKAFVSAVRESVMA